MRNRACAWRWHDAFRSDQPSAALKILTGASAGSPAVTAHIDATSSAPPALPPDMSICVDSGTPKATRMNNSFPPRNGVEPPPAAD
ncbi:MAG: hypothetical protein MK006_10885 [Pirellulales bacterium]|nr:hypothetical protein [Pirellulales bacterium]